MVEARVCPRNDRVKPVKTRTSCTNFRAMTEPWMSADIVSEHLGVTMDSIDTWIAKKDMPAHSVDRLWKFKITEIDDWVCSSGVDETAKFSKKGAC